MFTDTLLGLGTISGGLASARASEPLTGAVYADRQPSEVDAFSARALGRDSRPMPPCLDPALWGCVGG